MSLKHQGGVKHQIGDWIDCDGWVGLSEALGDRCEVRDGDLTAVFVYAEIDVAPNLVTDIFRWDTIFNKHADVTTDASNAIVGLWTGAITTSTGVRGWFQCGGQKLSTVNFAGVAICNNLLGDGSVAAGEMITPHASTDGMVDTIATDSVIMDIGISGEADAPAIALYNLFCRMSMV